MSDGPVADTRRWLKDHVVGLDLCPYARGPLETGRVRLVVASGELEARLEALSLELDRLMAASTREIETTLVLLPDAPGGFEDFLDEHELALELAAPYEGDVQVVVFHPHFCFDGLASDDPGNGTNRSPLPMWHLLREDSVARVVEADPEGVAAIPGRNEQTLRRLAGDQ